MIEIKNLTKQFGNLTAVQNLNISVKAGEIYGFVGPNGSGKTTTIKCAVSLLKPTNGDVLIDGYSISRQPEKAKQILGYIPDDPYIYERMTGIEFLHFIGQLWSIPRKEREERIEQLRTIYPISNILEGYLENYSRGNKQKTVILAALLHKPKVLFIDEPVVGLDPESVTVTKKLFLDFAHQKGGAIFVASHTLSVLEDICDKVGILKDGKLIAEGTLDELRTKAGKEAKTLEEMYLTLLRQNR